MNQRPSGYELLQPGLTICQLTAATLQNCARGSTARNPGATSYPPRPGSIEKARPCIYTRAQYRPLPCPALLQGATTNRAIRGQRLASARRSASPEQKVPPAARVPASSSPGVPLRDPRALHAAGRARPALGPFLARSSRVRAGQLMLSGGTPGREPWPCAEATTASSRSTPRTSPGLGKFSSDTTFRKNVSVRRPAR